MVGSFGGQADSYEVALRSRGLRVIAAADADSGIRFATTMRPSICIVDVSSPDGAGWDFCETFRQVLPLTFTPLVALANATGRVWGPAWMRARRLDCTLLANTIHLDDFVDCVATLISCARRA